jgi:hypothetical protein
MAAMSTGSKWLLGCGIGCGLVVLIFAMLGVGGFLFFRNTMESFELAGETRDRLDEAHGPAEDFVPWLDGAVPAERVEAFLAVRDSLEESRREFESTLDYLPEAERRMKEEGASTWEKIRMGLRLGQRGLGMGETIGEHFVARNRALLAHGMGVGEYTWLYAVAYYSFLGHSPADAHEKAEVRFGGDDDDAEFSWEDDDHDRRELRNRQRRIWRQTLSMLENQLAELDSLPRGRVDPAWRAEVQAEISRMLDEPGRVPWQDDLPPQMAASLEPYRDRLEATYSRVTNPFELGEGEGRPGVTFRRRAGD